MSFSYFCATDSRFLTGRGKEKPLFLGKHYNGKQRDSGGMSHLSCQGPAGPQRCCCSLPHPRSPCSSGQQQSVAPAANRWRATGNTLCRGASQTLGDNKGGLGVWCCSWGLLLSLPGGDQPAAWSLSLLSQAYLCPFLLPWRNQNWSPLSIILPFPHFSSWSSLLLCWPSFSCHMMALRKTSFPSLPPSTRWLYFGSPSPDFPFFLHSSANLQAACADIHFLATPHSLLRCLPETLCTGTQAGLGL